MVNYSARRGMADREDNRRRIAGAAGESRKWGAVAIPVHLKQTSAFAGRQQLQLMLPLLLLLLVLLLLQLQLLLMCA